MNDIFTVFTINITDFNLQIFNSWGEKLFESQDINQGWDGSFKGKNCMLGTYYYHITAKGANEETEVKTGNVHLLK
ncbi:MAG: T9SS type B sorting domain-containing protein [Bacteroidetes bacterium]|nr:T9SS type B sorting domain-containing protein [Bacteroidota bacterium]